jgi:hypothetical protein
LAITHPTQARRPRDPTIARRNPPGHPDEAGEYAEASSLSETRRPRCCPGAPNQTEQPQDM